jgi:8-oxo-dGTP diphosphatase
MIKFEVVAGVIQQENRILMCRSRGREHYYLPGGKINPSESLEEALIRECKEEITIDIIPSTIKLFSRFEAEAYGFQEPRIVIMNCFNFDYVGTIQAAAEIDDIFWAGMEDLEKLAPAGKILMKKRFMLDERVPF